MLPALLVLTQKADRTADYLCERLLIWGRTLVRLDTDALPSPFYACYDAGEPALVLGDTHLRPRDVAHVWYRRPCPLRLPSGPVGDPYEQAHVEREWAEAVEGVLAHIPVERWMNHPARNSLASHKIEQLSRATAHGFSVPPTLVTQDPRRLRTFWKEHGGGVIVKPLASGYIEREREEDDTAIYTSSVSAEQVEQATALERCPTLFQARIKKRLDIRATIVDDEIIAVGLRATDCEGQRLDIRRDNMSDVTYEPVEVPPEVRERILRLVRSYGLRFAALDFAIDDQGRWVFFEVNPNGQWAWLDLAGEFDIATAFDRSFFAA